MKSLRIASLVAALAVTAPVALVARQEPPFAAGDRVRVSAPAIVEKRVVGFVVSLDRDALVVRVSFMRVLGRSHLRYWNGRTASTTAAFTHQISSCLEKNRTRPSDDNVGLLSTRSEFTEGPRFTGPDHDSSV